MSTLDDILNSPLETGGLPVTEFKGVLKDVNLTDGENNRKRIVWDFTEAEIIQTREPYAFPTVQVSINYTNRDNTGYAAWKKSLEKVVNGPVSTDDLKGKRFHLKRIAFPVRGPVREADGSIKLNADGRQVWENMPMEVWQVVGIEGYANAQDEGNQFEELAELADGKTEEEFYGAIMKDSKLKANSTLINAVIARNLIPTMVTMGVVKVDGTKLTKV